MRPSEHAGIGQASGLTRKTENVTEQCARERAARMNSTNSAHVSFPFYSNSHYSAFFFFACHNHSFKFLLECFSCRH